VSGLRAEPIAGSCSTPLRACARSVHLPWRTAEELVEGEARTLRDFFESPDDGSRLLIAESGDHRLGFALLEELRDYFTLERHGHIGILAVTADAEGKGAGGALMRAAESWARDRGYRTLTLNVIRWQPARARCIRAPGVRSGHHST
jgi:GNAT superfamily N-acetyltransferase